MSSTTERSGDGAVKEQSFSMLLKLNWYKFNLECYNFRMLNVLPMVTTKKIAIENTQKEKRKEFKHFTTESQLNTKDSNAGNLGQKVIRRTENK